MTKARKEAISDTKAKCQVKSQRQIAKISHIEFRRIAFICALAFFILFLFRVFVYCGVRPPGRRSTGRRP